MRKELDDFLVNNFPIIYRDRYGKSSKETLMCFGFECHDGWFHLIIGLSKRLEDIAKKQPFSNNKIKNLIWPVLEKTGNYLENNLKGPPGIIEEWFWAYYDNFVKSDERLVAVQIKQKFGTARFYFDNTTQKAKDIIKEYENKSSITCEMCGEEGRLRNINGWYVTICDEDFAEIMKENEKSI